MTVNALPTLAWLKSPARVNVTLDVSPPMTPLKLPDRIAELVASYTLLAADAPVMVNVFAVMSAVRPVGWIKV